MPRAIVLVLDSLGIGASADAERFGDSGADTLGQVARSRAGQGGLHIPNLGSMGLVHAHHASTGYRLKELPLPSRVEAAWGYAREQSTGKDTPSGHWEMAGVPVRFDFGYFRERENSFPESLLRELIERAGLPGVLGNCHASGTEIIDRLGAEHLAMGKPIVYTSADSVFQVAAHEQQFGLERLYQVCQIARELLMPFNIGRVIARPFTGTIEAGFVRTGQRRDYSLMPPAPTVLDKLVASGGEVLAVGKIADIYAHSGISREIKADGNEALFDATLAALEGAGERSLVMTNFVDFDMLYGHRRDARGYADALEAFDRRLPELLAVLDDNDLLVLTADHGCDPSFPGSDHTREHVPVLARGAGLTAAALGARSSFADIGQSIAAHLELPPMADGRSFLP
ncbi:MAG: phosphopentomutase [Wenzhouxiangellaceae bacterium]|nr:MAG: phosphopentomutase [Wenzhouxiangellaceae bacterium]